MATTWSSADKIDVYNDDFVMPTTEVVAGNTIPIKSHLILSEDLFRLNPKQLKKLREIKEVGLFAFSPADAPERRKERGLGVAVAAATASLREAAACETC
jgi:hypothetical protein